MTIKQRDAIGTDGQAVAAGPGQLAANEPLRVLVHTEAMRETYDLARIDVVEIEQGQRR